MVSDIQFHKDPKNIKEYKVFGLNPLEPEVVYVEGFYPMLKERQQGYSISGKYMAEHERARLMATGAPIEAERGYGAVVELKIPKSRALSEEEIFTKNLPKSAVVRAYRVAKEDLMG